MSPPAPSSPEPLQGFAPLIKVDGSPLKAQAVQMLTSARIDRGFGLVARAVLRFDDPGLELTASKTFALGKVVSFTTFRTGEVLITGKVVALAMEARESTGFELAVTVDDAAGGLRTARAPRAALKQKAADVVQEHASAAKVRTRINATALGAVVHDYLLHTGTPLAYLEAVTARAGAVWFVEGETLRVEPSDFVASRVPLTLGEDLVTFTVRASASGPQGVEVRGWDNLRKQPVVGEATTTRPLLESEFVRGAHGRTGSAASSGISRIHQAAPVDAGEARALATAALAETTQASVVARGTCRGTGRLGPGVEVTVTRAGPANGTYRVTRVEHVYDSRGLRTSFTAGPARPTDLVDTLGPPAADPGMHLHGMVVGVVTNNKDPLGVGRVKVKIPDLSDEVESEWARVATIGGGSGRGIFFTPEINDEVLVAFEHGDTRRPLVLGGLFSERDKTPVKEAVTDGDVTKRHIASRRGHVIELSDAKAARAADSYVLLKNIDGALLRLGGDATDIDSGGQPLTVTGPSGSSIAIDAQGNITLTGTDITLKATGNVTVEGLGVTAKATTALQLEASGKAALKGAITSVESSGITEVKGSMVKIN